MKQIPRHAPGRLPGLAVMVLTGLGVALTGIAQAQQTGTDKVPFKIVIASKFRAADGYVLPFDPPLSACKGTGTGSNDLLGQVTYIEHDFVQFGTDGKPIWTEGMGVMTGANGDAVFFTYKGAVIEPVKTTFIIMGGKGRFRGASGSGIMTPSPGATPEDGFCAYDGVISAPKP
jgi:hypothetical protein